MWIFYRIINFIKRIPKEIKWFFFCCFCGCAVFDVLCLDYWLFRIVTSMFIRLKDT